MWTKVTLRLSYCMSVLEIYHSIQVAEICIASSRFITSAKTRRTEQSAARRQWSLLIRSEAEASLRCYRPDILINVSCLFCPSKCCHIYISLEHSAVLQSWVWFPSAFPRPYQQINTCGNRNGAFWCFWNNLPNLLISRGNGTNCYLLKMQVWPHV